MARVRADHGDEVVFATASTVDPDAIESNFRLTALPPADDVEVALPQPAASA
jgi:hypothetical protein